MSNVDNGESMLYHPELVVLVEEGTVKSCLFTATAGGFMLTVTSKTSTRILHTQRSKPRIFRNLETGLSYLKAVGIGFCTVEFSRFVPNQKSVF